MFESTAPSAIRRNHRPDCVVILRMDPRKIRAGDTIRLDIPQIHYSASCHCDCPEFRHVWGGGRCVCPCKGGHDDCRTGRVEFVQREISPVSGSKMQDDIPPHSRLHHEHFVNGHTKGQHRLIGGIPAVCIRTVLGNINMHVAVQKTGDGKPSTPCRTVFVT